MLTSVRTWLAPAAAAVLAAGLAGCGGTTSSASPTPSAPASFPERGEVILHDPFDDDSNGWGVIDSPEYGTAHYEGGGYVWRTTGRVVSLVPEILGKKFDSGALSMSDVVMDADVTIKKGGGVVGLQCRNSPDTDAGYRWYDFVARDGYVAIQLADDRSNIDVLAESKDVTIPLGKPFSISGACITVGDDVQLTVAINHVPLLTATVPAKPTDGAPGLVGWTHPMHSELDATWDQFTVSTPAG
jgi:hypothetical protein